MAFASNVHLNWLNWFHFLIPVEDPFVILPGCMTFVTFPSVARLRMSITTRNLHDHNSFFPLRARQWKFPLEVFSFDLWYKWLKVNGLFSFFGSVLLACLISLLIYMHLCFNSFCYHSMHYNGCSALGGVNPN